MKYAFCPFAFRLIFAAALGMATFTVHAAEPAAIHLKIALIGDSTVCDYPAASRQRGWGQLLPEFLTPGVTVMNVAKGGASTKTFPADRWQQVLAAKPDFVLIQFGHNDSHNKTQPEATDAATDYRDNLRRFIREARADGITPVLITPVRRRLFNHDGQLSHELLRYADAMKIVAKELSVPVIDLDALSGALYQRLGEAGSTDYTMNNIDHADRPGMGDRTHFTAVGARAMAGLVAGVLPQADPRLQAAVRVAAK